ncbi:MAG: 2Fe-2S iron-sulfur cluster-binding protein [Phycisphaerales bacterium]
MTLKPSDRAKGPAVVPVTIHMEDPESLTGKSSPVVELRGCVGQSLLELAMENGINIEHACGGVCACSTCHVYIEDGGKNLSESTEAEEDRVEEAPGLQRNSRLSCQCVIERGGAISVRIPSWNRNAVKEVPH